ncbi:hypothetical protein [Pseudomonas sp. OIL-1]|nr:hypothetical protein [Pseudomonas sp. OIL-1]
MIIKAIATGPIWMPPWVLRIDTTSIDNNWGISVSSFDVTAA